LLDRRGLREPQPDNNKNQKSLAVKKSTKDQDHN